MTWDDGIMELEPAPATRTDAVADQFARYVASCRRQRSPEIIRNLSSENARIIMANLIKLAISDKLDVRLVTGILDKNTYNPLEPLFEKLLSSVNRVKIMILDSINLDHEDNRVYDKVRTHPNGRVLCLNEARDSFPHFMVVGDVGYRIEFDDITKKASACFNDRDKLVVEHYTNLFRKKWNEAVQRGEHGDNRLFRTD